MVNALGLGLGAERIAAGGPSTFGPQGITAPNGGWEVASFWAAGGTMDGRWGHDGFAGLTSGGSSVPNVPIPPGATILSAEIAFTTTISGTLDTMTLFMDQGSTAGDPQDPGNANAPHTEWWPRRGAQLITGLTYGAGAQTISGAPLVAMIQELIDQAGWASGNRMNFGYRATGTWGVAAFIQMTFATFMLTITWE